MNEKKSPIPNGMASLNGSGTPMNISI
jgi:hypothetical protein